MRFPRASLLSLLLTLLLSTSGGVFGAEKFLSHPPMRPLPKASQRPMDQGPAYFVNAENGNNAADGSQQKPWRTINHALRQLKPGDTLYLRGGRYYEHVVVPKSGSEGQPITIRSYPGELAIIDGGQREFFEDPQGSWQPNPDGAEHEFVSTQTYPEYGERPIVHSFLANGWEPFYGKEDQRPVVLGHFSDSYVPLHGYRTIADLRDSSMLWDVDSKFEEGSSVYCGPGLWYNRDTGRIHIRLAHTNLAGLGERNYAGVTDPRQLPLIISSPYGDDVLRLNGVSNLVLQDLVLCGASSSPLINIYGADNIELDGCTLHGGSPGLLIKATSNFRMQHCAVRSLAAPWSSRASMKYRGVPSYAFISQRNKPQSHDFELAYNEFTDGHDCAWFRYVKNLRFHHNFMANFNDDGFEVGAKKRDQEMYVYQNLFTGCLLTFTLHEMDRDDSPDTVDPGTGVYITRNIVDLRAGQFKGPPREPDPAGEFLHNPLTLAGDHGGPTWPHYYVYHNTFISPVTAWRSYYGFGMGARGMRNTERQLLNNIFVQLEGLPGIKSFPDVGQLHLDGNLHWGLVEGPKYEGDFFQKEGSSKYPKDWMRHDLFADPKFTTLKTDRTALFDVTLQQQSPAINAGVPVPQEWFDPLRAEDAGQPDMGALPLGQQPWKVGVQGRISVFHTE